MEESFMFLRTSESLSNVVLCSLYSMCIVDGRLCFSCQIVTGLFWKDLCPNKELIFWEWYKSLLPFLSALAFSMIKLSFDIDFYVSFRRVQVPFGIVENNQKPQSSFLVVNMDGSRQPLPLTTVYSRLQPINSSPYAFLQALLFPEYPVSIYIWRSFCFLRTNGYSCSWPFSVLTL